MTTGLENLEIYKLAEELELEVFELTKNFPSDEKFRSVDQLRRSSTSVSDNIAEGYSRFSFNDKINKFYIARAETEETKRGIERAYKKGFISEVSAVELIDKYTVLIKGINGYIKFLSRQKENKENPSTQAPKYPSNQSISLLLVLLIISTLLMAGLTIGDLVLRHAQATKGIEFSELAYFAAESAIEKVVYKVFKEYCNINTASCQPGAGGAATGYLWTNGPEYTINQSNIVVDTVSSPWLATVSAGHAFQFSLDINGATYPTSLNISQNGNSPSELIVWQCETEDSGPRVCKSTPAPSQTFYPDLPQTINSLDPANYYYKIRINNRGNQEETYSIAFTGSLPIGLKINEAVGKYKNYTRKIKSVSPHFSKWQITGP